MKNSTYSIGEILFIAFEVMAIIVLSVGAFTYNYGLMMSSLLVGMIGMLFIVVEEIIDGLKKSRD